MEDFTRSACQYTGRTSERTRRTLSPFRANRGICFADSRGRKDRNPTLFGGRFRKSANPNVAQCKVCRRCPGQLVCICNLAGLQSESFNSTNLGIVRYFEERWSAGVAIFFALAPRTLARCRVRSCLPDLRWTDHTNGSYRPSNLKTGISGIPNNTDSCKIFKAPQENWLRHGAASPARCFLFSRAAAQRLTPSGS